jgi:ParB-like chromosome segregation protein Spo0J
VSEYYVVDGHHRVAMARKLGQDFLDAHVVAYRLAGTAEPADGDTALQTSDG